MLTIIAGEDSTASRNKLQELKNKYQNDNYSIQEVSPTDVPDLLKNAEGVTDLFGKESVYLVSNLSSKYKGREKTPFKDSVQELSQSTSIHLVDWENGKSAYELSGLKRIATTFFEAKPQKSIFELLDACVPGNLSAFLNVVDLVCKTQDIGFIYALLSKHVRKLILASENALDSKTAPWQRGKLKAQADRWDQKNLVKFYEGLARIDISMKTSSTPYDLRGSIELLVCYYLK